jgi:hypothetical protein
MELLLVLASSEGVDISKAERDGSKVKYRGFTFPGFNKPIKNTTGSRHKMIVLAKKGKRMKLIKFGHKKYEDFTTHKDKERRKRYRDRHRGVLTKDGKPAYKDKFQAAYWSWHVLW